MSGNIKQECKEVRTDQPTSSGWDFFTPSEQKHESVSSPKIFGKSLTDNFSLICPPEACTLQRSIF